MPAQALKSNMVPIHHWLLLTQYFPPEIGAPQVRLSSLIKTLHAHKIETRVLTSMPSYPLGKVFATYSGKFTLDEQIEGISVRRFWTYPAHGRSRLGRLTSYFTFACIAMFAVLLSSRPNVLFIEGQPLSLGFVGLVLKWLRGVPYILHIPDLQVDAAEQLGFIKNKTFLCLASHLEALCLRKAWKVTVPTHSIMRNLQKHSVHSENIVLLPNGVDSNFLKPKVANPEFLDRWNVRDKKAFTFVGTFSFYQGLDTILHAAKCLESSTDIVFIMVGNGPERKRIVRTAAQHGLTNIIFDELPYEKLADIYSVTYAAIASVCDIPVTRTMVPAKIMPALSCGVPVIYCGEGEAAQFISDKKCGICVSPEDGEKLAEAIARLAKDAKHRNEMGQSGRNVAVSEYDWKIIVEKCIVNFV